MYNNIMINSELLGHSFWMDNQTIMSAPTFISGEPDLDNAIAVEDWESSHELDSDQFQDLIRTIQKLAH